MLGLGCCLELVVHNLHAPCDCVVGALQGPKRSQNRVVNVALKQHGVKGIAPFLIKLLP